MKKLVTIVCLLLLSGCGWSPVYGDRNAPGNTYPVVEQALAEVQISSIPNREGQYLRNALIDRFYHERRPADPIFNLSVQPLRERLTDLDITKDSDATRGQLRLDTRFALSNKTTGEILLERELRSITSYNILGSEFTNRVSEENARQNAIDDLARQIELQLSLYFRR